MMKKIRITILIIIISSGLFLVKKSDCSISYQENGNITNGDRINYSKGCFNQQHGILTGTYHQDYCIYHAMKNKGITNNPVFFEKVVQISDTIQVRESVLKAYNCKK